MNKGILTYVVVAVVTMAVLACGVQVGYIINKNQNKNTESNEVNNNTNALSNEIALEDNTTEDNNTPVKKNTNTKNNQNEVPSNNEEETNNNEDTSKSTEKDKKVINKLNELLNNLKNTVKEADLKTKGKEAIITIVDFLFYDGEISGVTYDELTDAGQEKVKQMVANIDGFIESKVPGYKDTIKDKVTDAAYDALNELLAAYVNLHSYLANNLDFETYLKVIQTESNIINGVVNTVDKVKDTASNAKDKGSEVVDKLKDKADNWYQNWKNN